MRARRVEARASVRSSAPARCERHPLDEAVQACRTCNRGLCLDCLVYSFGEPFCIDCTLAAAFRHLPDVQDGRRVGRFTSSPEQFGHTLPISLPHPTQKVHS